jgi:hypothetical protein
MKVNASYVGSSMASAKAKAAENAAYYSTQMAPMKEKASEKMSGGYNYAASSAASI